MALSEEAFPPTIVNGVEVPHPATLKSQAGPVQRRAELSDIMFGREHELYGAHHKTDIVTVPEHHGVTGESSPKELYDDAKSAKDHTLKTRELLAAKFVGAGLAAAAVGIERRTDVIKVEMNKNIKQLKRKVKKSTAKRIGSTVVIPE